MKRENGVWQELSYGGETASVQIYNKEWNQRILTYQEINV